MECILLKSGGGTGSSDLTATRNQLLSGYTAITNDSNDDPIEGTIPVNAATANQTLSCGGSHTIKQGYHPQAFTVTANSLASQTSATAVASNILSGKTAYVNGNKITGTIASQAGGTLTPSTSTVTASCSGKYMTSNYTIPAFSLPAAGNIKKGATVTIYGKSVTGNFQGWVDSPLYVLKGGVFSGISSSAKITTYTTPGKTSLSFGYNSSNNFLYMYNGNTGGTSAVIVGRLEGALNLTAYNYMKVNAWIVDKCYNAGVNARIGISANASLSNNAMTAYTDVPYDSASSSYIINVSSLTGNYYFYMYLPAMRYSTSNCPELRVNAITLSTT